MSDDFYVKLESGLKVDPHRYMTDEAYRMAVDAEDDELIQRTDETEKILWDIKDAPNQVCQHHEVTNKGTPKYFMPAKMGKWLMDKRRMVVATNGLIYGSGIGTGEGLYVPCEDWILKMAQRSQGDTYISGEKRVLQWLNVELGDKKVDFTVPLPGGLINVKNGILNPQTGGLDPHNPAFVSAYQVPVEWHADATCPLIDKFLREALPGDNDSIDLMWEMVGYTLFGQGNRQKFFILRGPGGNGKSVWLWVVLNLIGRRFVQASSINELCDNKYRAAGLYGKRANICGDIGKRATHNTDLLKKLTGGCDVIEAEHKFGHPFDFVNKAVLIFSANEDPILLDKTQGMDDRPIFVDMPVRFRGVAGVEDPLLFQKLVTPKELRGALVRAAEGFHRLEKNDQFTLPASSVRLKKGFQASNSSAVRFWQECVWDTGDDKRFVFGRASVFFGYQQWCDDNGIKQRLGKKAFWEDIDGKVGPMSRRETPVKDQGRLLRGLALTTEGENHVDHTLPNLPMSGPPEPDAHLYDAPAGVYDSFGDVQAAANRAAKQWN